MDDWIDRSRGGIRIDFDRVIPAGFDAVLRDQQTIGFDVFDASNLARLNLRFVAEDGSEQGLVGLGGILVCPNRLECLCCGGFCDFLTP